MKGDNMEAGKHEFDGSCAPLGREAFSEQKTFSVGIFQWLPKSGGKGLKRSAVKVRVKGSVSDPDKVYAMARAIAYELDRGEYRGTKNVTA
jgi:hypothetical protein